MAGHSKWAQIKRKKAVLDSKRSAMFTKVIREITVAAKEGGANPDNNPRLRLAIITARKSNLPKDVIERAINKGSGNDGAHYQEVVYEGMGPGGVALMVECTTDNPTRTVANLRTHFNKNGGALGNSGSVGYLFERKGVFQVPVAAMDEESLTLELIDAGADDVENDGEFYTIYCPFEQFGAVNAKLESLQIEAESSELNRIANSTVQVGGENADKLLKLIDVLEGDDDVAKVFHNLELTDEVMAKM